MLTFGVARSSFENGGIPLDRRFGTLLDLLFAGLRSP
jgi:hypothetical protein